MGLLQTPAPYAASRSQLGAWRILGDRPASSIDQDAIDTYIATRAAEGVSSGTNRRDLSVLLAALRLAHRRKHIARPDDVVMGLAHVPESIVAFISAFREAFRDGAFDFRLASEIATRTR